MNIAVAQLEQAYCCSLTPLVTKNTMTYRNSYSYPVDHRSNIIQNWQQTVVCNHGSSTTTCSYSKVQKKKSRYANQKSEVMTIIATFFWVYKRKRRWEIHGKSIKYPKYPSTTFHPFPSALGSAVTKNGPSHFSATFTGTAAWQMRIQHGASGNGVHRAHMCTPPQCVLVLGNWWWKPVDFHTKSMVGWDRPSSRGLSEPGSSFVDFYSCF